MVQLLGALATLPKDPGSNLSTFIQAFMQIQIQTKARSLLWPHVPHACGKNIHTYNIKNNKVYMKGILQGIALAKEPPKAKKQKQDLTNRITSN